MLTPLQINGEGDILQALLMSVVLLLQAQSIADETWIRIPVHMVSGSPPAATIHLLWQGKTYPAESVVLREGLWLARFHVQARGQVQLSLDDSGSAAMVEPRLGVATEVSDVSENNNDTVCHSVTQPGETLWRIGSQLAGPNGDPYLYILALFAANREQLDNNPDELRIGDRLYCPQPQALLQLARLSQQERKLLYRRLVGYGHRLSRH